VDHLAAQASSRGLNGLSASADVTWCMAHCEDDEGGGQLQYDEKMESFTSFRHKNKGKFRKFNIIQHNSKILKL